MGKDQGFIMLTRGTDSIELLQDPNAFLLLTLIALRARRTNKGVNVQNLKIGECLIGDYKSCGLTEQKYKTAKKRLEEYGLATFKGTNKGTIAKLCNSTIYDINIDDDNEQTNEPTTNQQRAGQRSNNEPATTNNNVNNEKNEKNENKYHDFISGFKILQKFDKPLKENECEKLFKQYGKQNVIDVLTSLNNYKGAEKKYRSVYSTALEWLKRNQAKVEPEPNVLPYHKRLDPPPDSTNTRKFIENYKNGKMVGDENKLRKLNFE